MFFVPTDGEVAESLGLHRLELTIEKPRATFDLTVLVQWRRHRPSTNRFGVPMATGFAVDVVPRRRDAEKLLRYVEEVDYGGG